MASKKMISAFSTIERALGIIEGISYTLDSNAATALVDAVQMVDEAVKELKEDGNMDTGK